MPKTTITRRCQFCGNVFVKTFDSDKLLIGIQRYNAGALIQDAFPDFTLSEREFLKTGICDDCWDSL